MQWLARWSRRVAGRPVTGQEAKKNEVPLRLQRYIAEIGELA